jgi:hypothetical protein
VGTALGQANGIRVLDRSRQVIVLIGDGGLKRHEHRLHDLETATSRTDHPIADCQIPLPRTVPNKIALLGNSPRTISLDLRAGPRSTRLYRRYGNRIGKHSAAVRLGLDQQYRLSRGKRTSGLKRTPKELDEMVENDARPGRRAPSRRDQSRYGSARPRRHDARCLRRGSRAALQSVPSDRDQRRHVAGNGRRVRRREDGGIGEEDPAGRHQLRVDRLELSADHDGQFGALDLPAFPLFVYLVLAAQYASWTLPLSILLIVPMVLLTGSAGVRMLGGDINILTQIGFIVLVGLAAKNAILIVEIARQLEDVGNGMVQAIVKAARLRLRPILMTSFAFILGVLPLVTSNKPGAEMRQAMGIAVFFGMLGVTLFGLLFAPIFYAVVRRLFGAKAKRTRANSPERFALAA